MHKFAAIAAWLALAAPGAGVAAQQVPPAAGAASGEVQAPARARPIESEPASGGRTLWLVQPLYPGQEALVERTEAAIGRLFSSEGPPASEVIGRGNLALLRPDTGQVESCLFGDRPCDDPVGALVAAYGLKSVILIKAGQDGAGYRFRVAAFEPGTFRSATAENADAKLESALLGALVKVAPLASHYEIVSQPPGATVFIDGERVGVTPLTTQALPGERTFRLELSLHETVEWKEQVPVRGRFRVERTLEETPAMIVVQSEGASIFVDGERAGQGEARVGVEAGKHRVRLERDGHEPWETTVEVSAGQELRVERKLEPTGWHSFSTALSREQEKIYARDSFFSLTYDSFRLVGDKLAADSIGLSSRKSDRATPETPLWGVSAEYGVLGRHIGLVWLSGTFFQSADPFSLHVADGGDGPVDLRTKVMGGQLRLLHPQLRLAIWRFALDVQGGFVGRLAHVKKVSGEGFSRGFLLADLGVDVQGGVKLFVVDGLFLEGAYLHSFTITGSTEGMTGFRGGFGYAF